MLILTYQGQDNLLYESIENLLSESGGFVTSEDFFKGETVLMVNFKSHEGRETFESLLNKSDLKYKVQSGSNPSAEG